LLYAPEVKVEITIDDRMTQHHLSLRLLAQLFVLLQLLAAVPASADEQTFSSKWRMISADEKNSGPWTDGTFANLGFTDDQLEFEVIPTGESTQPRYLVMTPIYIDHLDVTLVSRSTTEQLSLGDHQPQSDNKAVVPLPGKIAVMLPTDILKVDVRARSTSNLRLTIELHDEDALWQLQKQTIFGTAVLFALITISSVAALVFWSLNRSPSLMYFAAYQISWGFLLSGIFYPITPAKHWDMSINNYVVSLGAMFATLTGALTHAQILSEFTSAKIAAAVLRLVSALSATLIVVFLLGFKREALELNILLISVVPLLIIFIILSFKPEETRSIVWRRIQFGYIVLMGSVVLTGVSGLGVGKLFDITYVHALLTTLLLSVILLLGIRDKSARVRAALQRSKLELSRGELIEEQLAETKAMFEMLSHEIKTPLTTLSMLLHKFPNRQRAAHQIDAIRTIIEQTALAIDVPGRQPDPAVVSVFPAIISNWRLYADTKNVQSLDIKVEPSLQIRVDRFLLDVLLRNLIKNAVKYSEPGTSPRVYTKIDHTSVLLVFSNVSKIAYAETPQFFSKYWRAAESKRSRGTGLGLWIVKRICDSSGFEVDARFRGRRFRLIVNIPIFRVVGSK